VTLPIFPQDKANHVIYGAAIFSAVLFVAHMFSPAYQIAIASGAVALMAVAKEASDALINHRTTGDPIRGPHGVELLDAVATCFGGILAALPMLIVSAS